MRRLSGYLAISLGAFLLATTLVFVLFGATILNGYGRQKAERSFARAYPGFVLRIGELAYATGGNRLLARSVAVSGTGAKFTAERITMTGVGWARLFWKPATFPEALAGASLEATNVDLEFPRELYGIRCSRLRASAPRSELIAEGTELRPPVGDEAFFSAHGSRTPRFRVVLPECTLAGLAFQSALAGKSYQVESIHLSRPTLEALINRDKPPAPFTQSPSMVHEALAFIRPPLNIGSLSVTDGRLTYSERLSVGAAPGIFTLGAVNMMAEGIANRGGTNAAAAIQIRGQAELMDAGAIKLLMSIPIAPADFSLRYSGSLGAMDLTRLSAFLDPAEHTRIKSGTAHEASFEIEVRDGHARGRLHADYRDLEIALLDKQTGDEKGMRPRVESFFANLLKIRDSNPPGKSGKVGIIHYTRQPGDEFQQFVWFALRTGVLDVIKP